MPKLEKATLVKLKEIKGETEDATIWEPDGKPVAVQLNPTSLQFQRSNNTNRSQDDVSTQGQTFQFASSSPATLSFELEFDTADEGTTAKPIDVRTKSALVRQFVEPPPGKTSASPPRARFQWGELIFTGIFTQFSEDLDFFAANGTPLQSKVSLSIVEQDLKFQNAVDARTPTAAAASGGISGGGGLGASISGGVSASAGIGASAGFSAGAGIGAGFEVSGGLSLDASAGASLSGGIGASVQAGGGVSLGADAVAGFGVGVAPFVTSKIAGGLSSSGSVGLSVGGGFGIGGGGGLSASGSLEAGTNAGTAAAINTQWG